MAMVYPIQMLLVGFSLLLAFPLAASTTMKTTSKEEIKCDSCMPVIYPSPPPPVVIECPPPPSPPSLPPPSPSPPPPCRGCPPPCSGWCPPPCPACPPPPCNACQIPNTPVPPGPPRPPPMEQPGVMGGAVYSPPNEVVPYFPYSYQNPPSQSAPSSTHLELKLAVSIIFLLLSLGASKSRRACNLLELLFHGNAKS
ncbi:leucine-rich repeat extensin-like protein 3 [Durio zibethinus]|uniref:Leucine-rich repeat extensin-like protein 3 n=1 Tax=Durio zibethinus TaxID=66656 RepID=A0A6P6A4Y5_DURZI|nr:leucine-rich repeat extensin-like protein 3 [Durio zibethinus]